MALAIRSPVWQRGPGFLARVFLMFAATIPRNPSARQKSSLFIPNPEYSYYLAGYLRLLMYFTVFAETQRDFVACGRRHIGSAQEKRREQPDREQAGPGATYRSG